MSNLQLKQNLPLEDKILLTNSRIFEWYHRNHSQVYVSFSGGKDSTVLLNLVREQFPQVPAVFIDTGLEFPEIRDFVKTVENVIWLKPKKNFKQVIEQFGYPVISKEQARFLSDLKNPTEKNKRTRDTRLFGSIQNGKRTSTGKLSQKYHYLIDAPFKISDNCCNSLKKAPTKDFHKKSGLKPFIGTMAEDSRLRSQSYSKFGCNGFNMKGSIQSRPLMFWKESDVWDYIKTNQLSYSKIYDMGYKRTGCVFCGFGITQEKESRFLRLKQTHPSLYKYCMENLGMKRVFDFINTSPKINIEF